MLFNWSLTVGSFRLDLSGKSVGSMDIGKTTPIYNYYQYVVIYSVTIGTELIKYTMTTPKYTLNKYITLIMITIKFYWLTIFIDVRNVKKKNIFYNID